MAADGVVRSLLLAAGLVCAGVAAAIAAEQAVPQSTAAAAPEPPPVYCPLCGARNRGGSRFCLKDGSELPTLDPGRFNAGFRRALET